MCESLTLSAATGKGYKIVFLPGVTALTHEAIAKIKSYLASGGTVVMTSRTAMTDQHGQVLKTTQPGELAEVFGIRLGGILSTAEGRRIDEIELRGATAEREVAWYGKSLPLITSHAYGKGKAVYVGVAASDGDMYSIIAQQVDRVGVSRGPELPQFVSGRWIDSNHLLLLNHTSEDKTVPVQSPMRSILTGQTFRDAVVVKANDADFLEKK